MRFVLKALVAATLLLVLVIAGVIGDLVFNQRRVFYALLGRDGLVDACAPALLDKLRDAGFEPAELELGPEPDITITTATGKNLQDTFTFRDGAAQTRVDGLLVCAVRNGAVTTGFRTRSTPSRTG